MCQDSLQDVGEMPIGPERCGSIKREGQGLRVEGGGFRFQVSWVGVKVIGVLWVGVKVSYLQVVWVGVKVFYLQVVWVGVKVSYLHVV